MRPLSLKTLRKIRMVWESLGFRYLNLEYTGKKKDLSGLNGDYCLYPFCKKKPENDSIRLLMSHSHDLTTHLMPQWPERAPSRQGGMDRIKGHNIIK
jgi:hypothetical protein